MGVNVVAGAVSGGLMSKMSRVKVAVVSSSKGNMKAVAQTAGTKIANGTASSVSFQTAVKGAIVGQVANIGRTAAQAAIETPAKKLCGEKCL